MKGKRTPSAIKKRQGTFRPSRDFDMLIEGLSKMPEPSPGLNLSEKAEALYYEYGTQLLMNGLMTFIDLVVFNRYCKLYDRALELSALIDEGGITQETQSGYVTLRPEVSLLNQIELQMLKIEDRFGMSPAARTRVNPVQKKKKNDLDELMA